MAQRGKEWLAPLKASNVAQKKGGQAAKAQQYEEVKNWCRAKFEELRAVTPKTKVTKEALCNDVAEAAVAEKDGHVYPMRMKRMRYKGFLKTFI